MQHGGDISGARAGYGEPAGGWLDLSTGINPIAYPFSQPDAHHWRQLPQAADERALLDAARKAYRIADGAAICAAPGTQSLIQIIARLRPNAEVAIVGPTYSEHAIAWDREGGKVRIVDRPETGSDADVLVVVNPNNPTCSRYAPDELIRCSERMRAAGGLLVVDEAFADVDPGISLAQTADSPGLVILRSFGKFYGLGGLRLGFAIGHTDDISQLSDWLGPWATPGPALAIGRQALADEAWTTATRTAIADASAHLAAILVANDLELLGNAGLFVLVRHPRARDIHHALATRGIWIRRFDDQPTWLRFGLPGQYIDRVSQTLRAAMAEVTSPR
jgi:cobalamin biosynthetic protein CobC